MAEPFSFISISGTALGFGSLLGGGTSPEQEFRRALERTRETRERLERGDIIIPRGFQANLGDFLQTPGPAVSPEGPVIPDIEPVPGPPPESAVIAGTATVIPIQAAIERLRKSKTFKAQARRLLSRVRDLIGRGRVDQATAAVRRFLALFKIDATNFRTLLAALLGVEIVRNFRDVVSFVEGLIGSTPAVIEPVSVPPGVERIPVIPPIPVRRGLTPLQRRAILAAAAAGGGLIGVIAAGGDGRRPAIAPTPSPAPRPSPTPTPPPAAPPAFQPAPGVGGLASFPAALISPGGRRDLLQAQLERDIQRTTPEGLLTAGPLTLQQARQQCEVKERKERDRTKCREGFFREFRNGTAFIPWREIPCR